MSKLSGFEFVTTLVLEFDWKGSDNKPKYCIFCSTSKTETFINKTDIGNVLESIYITTVSNIKKSLGKVLG